MDVLELLHHRWQSSAVLEVGPLVLFDFFFFHPCMRILTFYNSRLSVLRILIAFALGPFKKKTVAKRWIVVFLLSILCNVNLSSAGLQIQISKLGHIAETGKGQMSVGGGGDLAYLQPVGQNAACRTFPFPLNVPGQMKQLRKESGHLLIYPFAHKKHEVFSHFWSMQIRRCDWLPSFFAGGSCADASDVMRPSPVRSHVLMVRMTRHTCVINQVERSAVFSSNHFHEKQKLAAIRNHHSGFCKAPTWLQEGTAKGAGWGASQQWKASLCSLHSPSEL